MLFEWDDAKYKSNLQKHGIGFRDAAKVFAAAHTVTPSKQPGEKRFLATGVVDGRYITVVFAVRGDTVRIISARRARDEEKNAYQAL